MTIGDTWYRYVDVAYAGTPDEYDNPTQGYVAIQRREYTVVRETPCGVQLSWMGTAPRFVNRSWRKRFACPTDAEALESYIARKRRQLAIYEARARQARECLAQARSGNPIGRVWPVFMKEAI